jgi:hypothetical protein
MIQPLDAQRERGLWTDNWSQCHEKKVLNVVFSLMNYVYMYVGRATAQAVSRRLPTAAARVRYQFRSCGICGGQSGAWAGFLRVLWFPLPIFIPPIAPQSPSSITWSWYNRPVVAAVPSGLSLTPLRIIKNNIHVCMYVCMYVYFENHHTTVYQFHYRVSCPRSSTIIRKA